MTVEARLKAILDTFGDPVENGVYLGEAERYYTFGCKKIGDDFADDVPQHERVLVQVHFFAPLTFNTINRIRKTKLALLHGGFLWPEEEDLSDKEGRHVLLETETVEEGTPGGENDD